jgi:hypothetical protein
VDQAQVDDVLMVATNLPPCPGTDWLSGSTEYVHGEGVAGAAACAISMALEPIAIRPDRGDAPFLSTLNEICVLPGPAPEIELIQDTVADGVHGHATPVVTSPVKVPPSELTDREPGATASSHAAWLTATVRSPTRTAPLRDEAVLAATLMVSDALPDPLRGDTEIQLSDVALHAQPAGAETAAVKVPPSTPEDCDPGDRLTWQSTVVGGAGSEGAGFDGGAGAGAGPGSGAGAGDGGSGDGGGGATEVAAACVTDTARPPTRTRPCRALAVTFGFTA